MSLKRDKPFSLPAPSGRVRLVPNVPTSLQPRVFWWRALRSRHERDGEEQDQHRQGQKFPRVEDRPSAETTARHSLGIGACLLEMETRQDPSFIPFPCLGGIALKEPEGGSNLDDPPMPVAGADKRGSGTAGIRDLLLVASFASIDSWPAVKRFFMCPSLPFPSSPLCDLPCSCCICCSS